MGYEEGERDLLIMQQKFVVEWKDGSEVCTIHLLPVLQPVCFIDS